MSFHLDLSSQFGQGVRVRLPAAQCRSHLTWRQRRAARARREMLASAVGYVLWGVIGLNGAAVAVFLTWSLSGLSCQVGGC